MRWTTRNRAEGPVSWRAGRGKSNSDLCSPLASLECSEQVCREAGKNRPAVKLGKIYGPGHGWHGRGQEKGRESSSLFTQPS
jgi:hypothetical protein